MIRSDIFQRTLGPPLTSDRKLVENFIIKMPIEMSEFEKENFKMDFEKSEASL